VTLIDATAGGAGALDLNGFDQTQAQGQHGATLSYLWNLDTAGEQLTATVNSVKAVPQTKALSEGFLSGLALTILGGDLVAGPGLSQAQQAAWQAFEGGYTIGTFAAVSLGSLDYNSGSSIDMSSVSLLAGLAWGADLDPARLTLGTFFEYGRGSYDTYNSFAGAADVYGDGRTYHVGGGLLSRLDFAASPTGQAYAEAGLRAGRVHNDYKSSPLRDYLGQVTGSYETSSAYFGAHLGGGYIFNLSEQASLDLYGKYFWTRVGGQSVTLSSGDPVDFEALNSHRLRAGGRLAYAVNEQVKPYVGAAYEYEFGGEANASTYGYAIDAPKLRGSTGLGELGLSLKPSSDLALSFDLGVQGYVGKREGVTGSFQVRFDF